MTVTFMDGSQKTFLFNPIFKNRNLHTDFFGGRNAQMLDSKQVWMRRISVAQRLMWSTWTIYEHI